MYLMMMYSLGVVHSTPSIPSLNSLINNRAGTLLILTYAATSKLFIATNTFHGIFEVCFPLVVSFFLNGNFQFVCLNMQSFCSFGNWLCDLVYKNGGLNDKVL